MVYLEYLNFKITADAEGDANVWSFVSSLSCTVLKEKRRNTIDAAADEAYTIVVVCVLGHIVV